MGFMLKIVLIIVALGGIGVGKFGLSGETPESIAVGVLGVIVALISMVFFLKFLWKFLGCLSTIIIAFVIVVILLILTGTFDTVTAKVMNIFSGSGGAQTSEGQAGQGAAGQNPASGEYIPVTQQDGSTAYVPVAMLVDSGQQEVSTASMARQERRFVGSISGIRSGSQFVINDLKVLLFGIDTPDPDQTCSDKRGRPYQCGQEAIRQLKKFTGATPLDCKVMSQGQSDMSLVSAVCNINNNDLGVAMVSSGWAFANPYETKVYIPYEQAARNAKNGMWAGQFYAPSEWRRRKENQRSGSSSSSSLTDKAKSLFGGLF